MQVSAGTDSTSLRIVHIDTGTELRGGQHQVLILARGLRQRGHKQLVVCPEGSGLETRARAESLELFTLPLHDSAHAHGVLDLRRRVGVERPDIVHAHDGRGHSLSWLATVGLPVPRIATRRVTFPPSLLGALLIKHNSACARVIAASEAIRQALASAGVPQRKIKLIPDGVDVPRELPGAEFRSRVRAGWGFGDQEFIIGHLGAFTPEKGQEAAIEAMVSLAEDLPQARLVLAGEGPTRRSLETSSSMRGSNGRVRFVGYVDDVAEFFPGLDLFLMPSRAEGLGSSALLAMAYGIPVAASRVGGLPEIVQDGETGWLVQPGAPDALAQAILAAASDRELLRRLGCQARARAQNFASDIMVSRTEALYRKVLARSRPRIDDW